MLEQMFAFTHTLHRGAPAISGGLLSAVISIRCIFGFRKDNSNVFNSLIQNWPHFNGIKCICC